MMKRLALGGCSYTHVNRCRSGRQHICRIPGRSKPCHATSDNEEKDFRDQMEDILSSAKDLRQQYFDVMREASAIRGDGDASRRVREELFRMSLQELQASLGVYDSLSENHEEEEEEELRIVEEYAAMIERGEDIPPPPEGTYYEDKESAESFTKRLQSSFELFRDVVQGKVKVGQLLGREGDVDWEEELLTDVPEEKSRFVPDIPQRAMDMYIFGERVMYILRRGYKSQTFIGPLELLDSYGLLHDDVVVQTRWADIRGIDAARVYCSNIDRVVSCMQCSNLLMSYPQFTESDTNVIAEGTCDILFNIPVPSWYTSYCMSTGKGRNTVSVREQMDLGIDIPETLFPWNAAKARQEENPRILHTMTEYRDCIGITGILSDETWISDGCDSSHDRQDKYTIFSDAEKDIDDMTPDEAEEILRSLFGDNFDAIAQQLPKKQSIPPNIDLEYQPMFEEDTPNEIKCAVTWTFKVDLVAKQVCNIAVEYRWINMGCVHEEDVFYVLAIETGEYLCIMNG